MKKLFAMLGMAAMVFAFGGTAYASTISNINDDSVISIIDSWLGHLNLTNTNTATITNVVTSTANSGGNTITSEDDQSGTTITTGGANAASTVDNVANANDITVAQETPTAMGDTVDMVNDDLDSTQNTTVTDDHNQINDNTVTVTNDVTATSQTGGNTTDADDDQDTAATTSGLAQALTAITNSFNLNVQSITRTLRNF